MKLTQSNYFTWRTDHALPNDKDLIEGDALLALLTQNGTDWSTVNENPDYKELADRFLTEVNKVVAVDVPVKPTAPQPNEEATTKKETTPKKKSKSDFAERMKAARNAKKGTVKTKESTVSAAPSATKDQEKKAISPPQTTESSETTQQPQPEEKATASSSRPGASDQAYFDAKKVSYPTLDVQLIRRFVGLVKHSTKEKLIAALEALNKALTQRRITKESPLATEIMAIQAQYVDVLNRGQAPYTLHPDEKTLARYVAIAGGERVYKSVELLAKFINWTGETRNEKQIKQLLTEMRNAKAKGKIKSSDPYAKRIDAIIDMLTKAVKARSFDAREYDLSGFSGLAGMLGCACGGDGLDGLGNLPTVQTMPDVMSAEQMAELSYPTYNLTGSWKTLLGTIAQNTVLMVWGKPGQGKSTFSYKLARYIASSLGKVLYLSSEEYPSLTMAKKIELVGGSVPGWEFTNTIERLDASHKLLVIDSVNHYGYTREQLKALRAKRPDLMILLIFQATKTGQFKGGQEWEHDVDIVLDVSEGQATSTKNRFAALTSITIFS